MDSSFNASRIFESAVGKLSGTYEKEEAAANVRWLMEEILGFSRVDIAMQKPQTNGEKALQEFRLALKRLSTGEPIQYVLGYSEFLGNKYLVNPFVLIPRPETEELVMKIVQDNPTATSLLDIGTGSGCIAISLAQALKHASVEASVEAWDIDNGALDVATRNARNLGVMVQFEQVDALGYWPDRGERLDLIVSNPPYITAQEKQVMRPNVLDHEPAKALFVPNDDPLLFYRVIGEKSRVYLSEAGKLYFEINENFGEAVVKLLQEMKYKGVKLHKDFQDKPRMVEAYWPG